MIRISVGSAGWSERWRRFQVLRARPIAVHEFAALHAIGRSLTLRVSAADNTDTPARTALAPLGANMNMKRLWLCVASTLFLTSCVPVDEFGTYWDKGFVDPALEGSWMKLGRSGDDLGGIPLCLDVWRFTKTGASYSLQGMNRTDRAREPDVAAQMKPDSELVTDARTLRIGRKLFLMERDAISPGDGLLMRYEVHARTLNVYFLDIEAAVDFLEKGHPDATNIRRGEGGGYVFIGTFDDEVFRILSEFVDDPAHWIRICQYRKTSK
jgi:hypothetical protein